MANCFFISDPHFGHAGVCKFLDKDGVKIRPWTDPEEMNEALVENWNSVVREQDKVYCLGDVVINRRYLPILHRLKGHKTLIRGNHDVFKLKEYMTYFGEVHGVRVLEGLILSHIPLHKASVVPRFGVNVHGHLHTNYINDPAYLCVCVEQINFTPLSLEDARKLIVTQRSNFEQFGDIKGKKEDERQISSEDIDYGAENPEVFYTRAIC